MKMYLFLKYKSRLSVDDSWDQAQPFPRPRLGPAVIGNDQIKLTFIFKLKDSEPRFEIS